MPLGAPDPTFETFDEALDFFRRRTPMPASQFYSLQAQAREKAFTVSGTTNADVIQDVLSSLDRALEEGQGLKSWKAEIRYALQHAWSGTVADPGFRLETIYRNNVQTAFSHGRVRQMREPVVAALRPYWLLDATLDGRETDLCHGLDGTLLLQDDPRWSELTPPLHHRCRTLLRALRRSQATAKGGVKPPPDGAAAQKGWGAAPSLDPAEQVTPWVPEREYDPLLKAIKARKDAERPKPPTPPKQDVAPDVFSGGSVLSRKPIGVGSHGAELVSVRTSQGKTIRAVFKRDPTPQELEELGLSKLFSSGLSSREDAAYRIDRMLGGETVVPETTATDLGHGRGSYQRLVPRAADCNPDRMSEAAYDKLLNKHDSNDARRRKMFLLDVLTGNTDRHEGNVIRSHGKLWAIDNGYSFPDQVGENEFFFLPFQGGNAPLLRLDIDSSKQLLGIDESSYAATLKRSGASQASREAALARMFALRRNPNIIDEADGAFELEKLSRFLSWSYLEPGRLGLTADELDRIEELAK